MRDLTFIGVDPGATGAIGVVHRDSVYAFDVPMRLVRRGDSDKPVTDIPQLWSLCSTLADLFPNTRVCIERVWGAKKQGGSAGAALGHHRAMLEAAFYTFFGKEPELISPQKWKGDLGLIKRGEEADKGKSLQLALHAFPQHTPLFTPVRKRSQEHKAGATPLTEEQAKGRAEACLIAKWARDRC